MVLNSAGSRTTARPVADKPPPVIAPSILKRYPDLNDAQKEIVGHVDGPLLVIAGPGSGKTYSIVLRALNLLLLGKAAPKQIILCTFTEKAAFEMRDRLAAAARLVVQKRSDDNVNWIIETKGRVWEGTAAKDEAIHDWCERVSEATGAEWRYMRVNQTEFDSSRATALGDLVDGH